MGKDAWKIFKKKDIGSIGIGAMIVFIAMVLVAGIAASVLIQTAVKLESQAMVTGQETTAEVSSGLAVVNVVGKNVSGSMMYLAITIRPRAGSSDIDIGEVVIEISDSHTKNFLKFQEIYTAQEDVDGDIFSEDYYTIGATNFSVIVLEDADNSCSSENSLQINSGDYVALGVNVSACFGGLDPRDDVWGSVMPEEGSPGVINFKCPPSFTTSVIDLQ